MKQKVRCAILAFILAMLMLLVCGCAAFDPSNLRETETTEMTSQTSIPVTLNERQKEILTNQNLSTDYRELTSSQQKAIVAIEEMLQAVELKYGMAFSYAGYTAGNSIEKETLWAYPVNGDKETEIFTVVREIVNGTENYTDTFIHVAATHLLSTYVEESLSELALVNNARVYSEISETTLVSIPVENTEFDGCVEAALWIFIDGSTYTQEQLDNVIVGFETWMVEHQIYGSVQYILLKEGILPYLTEYNFSSYLSGDYYLTREYSNVNK